MRTKLIPMLKNARGFSLLEVLIALTITGVITAAVMRTYVTQHRNYMVQGRYYRGPAIGSRGA